MINLHERMLPTSAGVEPATSWSPVGRRIQLSHRGAYFFYVKSCLLPGFSSRRLVILMLVILMFYLDTSMAHYFIYSLPVCINALFACYMPLLTIQVIVFNILNQARSRFRKDVGVLKRTQNFLSSDIPLTNINLSSDIPASYLRHPVTNKYDNSPKEI